MYTGRLKWYLYSYVSIVQDSLKTYAKLTQQN